MSVAWMTRVWQSREPRRTTERLLLLALADNANDEGICWPSIDTLSRKCASDRRTIQRRLAVLEEEEFIVREVQPGHKTRYRLVFSSRPERPDRTDVEPRQRGGQNAARGQNAGAARMPPPERNQGAADQPPAGGQNAAGGAVKVPPEPSINHHGTVSSMQPPKNVVPLRSLMPGAADAVSQEKGDGEHLFDLLRARGIDRAVAERLVRDFDAGRIRRQVHNFDRERPASPGWLVRAIEEDYADRGASEKQSERYTHQEALDWLGQRRIVLSQMNPLTKYFDVVREDGAAYFVRKA